MAIKCMQALLKNGGAIVHLPASFLLPSLPRSGSGCSPAVWSPVAQQGQLVQADSSRAGWNQTSNCPALFS